MTTSDGIGDPSGPEPATPGTYGEAPAGFRLPEGTRLGRVRLQVASLERSLGFYERTLGLRILRRAAGSAVLAAHGEDRPLIELRERVGARPMTQRGRLGLYHFAILLPNRASLGRFVRHLGEIGARAGAGDHLVSEAFYLSDPDGLGIEVYADRPRSAWRRIGRELVMATDPVDVPDLVRAAGAEPWEGMPAGTTIGHVHLHVGDTALASAFFSEGLGFDRMVWSYPGALFFGAAGYHHHLGANTWAGSHAAPPTDGDARLLEWTIELPDSGSLAAVGESLRRAGLPVASGPGDAAPPHLVSSDPWGTGIRLVARAGPESP